jgi:hypothetical protein
MWQNIIVAVLVIGAAVYAARMLGPRRWRRRTSGAAAGAAPGAAKRGAGDCGCGKDGNGCH